MRCFRSGCFLRRRPRAVYAAFACWVHSRASFTRSIQQEDVISTLHARFIREAFDRVGTVLHAAIVFGDQTVFMWAVQTES